MVEAKLTIVDTGIQPKKCLPCFLICGMKPEVTLGYF